MEHFVIEHVYPIPKARGVRAVKSYIEVKDGKIVTVKPGDYPERENGVSILDGRGKWLSPGLYNTHGHTPMTMMRGVSDDVVLQEWLNNHVWPRERLFTNETAKAGTGLALAEMIRTGTTGFLDMYHMGMQNTYELVKSSGIKSMISKGMMSIGTPEEQSEKLAAAARDLKEWEQDTSGRITGMLFPHAPYTCTPEFLEKVVDAGHKHSLPLGIHLEETAREVADYQRDYGMTPAKKLKEIGFYTRPAMLTHVVHATDEDLDDMNVPEVTISYNPMSNAKLGSGIARIPEMQKRGLRITIGTDSAVSNNNLDMFEELRLGALMQKVAFQDPSSIETEAVWKMATENGAASMGFGDSGKLEAGAAADFILLNSESFALQPYDNILSHLVYAASGRDVTDSFVNGRQLMKDGELLTLDEEKITAEANRHYRKLNEAYL
ncbi:amidohydrolase [Marinococcus sp. PL1-022]|uniref:amidohydrolase n=1 Tax=Marinococcus sp. PL1-022 TaxID=3095363 RepID=UPI0029C1F84B|nr:amidohydrolase [Marinococcus sp. PL1-022]MDX6152975.1 amidohydrolase [Marinococcus sp. PL1-022]